LLLQRCAYEASHLHGRVRPWFVPHARVLRLIRPAMPGRFVAGIATPFFTEASMHTSLWIARSALATIFIVAGTSKLRSRAALRELVDSLPAFGIPSSLATSFVAAMLALAELATAALLVAVPRAGGIAAALLLAGFAVGIAKVITSHAPVTCRCFGASAQPVGKGAALAIAAIPAVALAPSLPLAAATLGGLALGALITRWDDLAFIFSTPDLPARRARQRSTP
jgi:uncharacterized membrane protein YphA (DoxX/SURF4 family)